METSQISARSVVVWHAVWGGHKGWLTAEWWTIWLLWRSNGFLFEKFCDQISQHACCQTICYALYWICFNITGVVFQTSRLSLCCDLMLTFTAEHLQTGFSFFPSFLLTVRSHKVMLAVSLFVKIVEGAKSFSKDGKVMTHPTLPLNVIYLGMKSETG